MTTPSPYPPQAIKNWETPAGSVAPVLNVLNLQHLERLLEVAGSSIVVLGLYSRV